MQLTGLAGPVAILSLAILKQDNENNFNFTGCKRISLFVNNNEIGNSVILIYALWPRTRTPDSEYGDRLFLTRFKINRYTLRV